MTTAPSGPGSGPATPPPMPTAPPAQAPVPIALDLRGHARPPRDVEGYVALWQSLEPYVVRADPRQGSALTYKLGDDGTVVVRFLAPHAVALPMTAETPFAIRGIAEPPQVRYRCDTCQAAGTVRYAPYRCVGCEAGGKGGNGGGRQAGRACEEHASFLPGSLRASCPGHPPACGRCERPAGAWCAGPRCRGRRAWCEQHVRRHPGDRGLALCHGCYTARFPTCERGTCEGTAYIRCEHLGLDAGRPCGHSLCAEHARRWQIYGPSSRGVALCNRHFHELRKATPEQLLDVVVGVAVARAESGGGGGGGGRSRRGTALPRISVVRHIFINTQRRVLDMDTVAQQFTRLEKQLRGTRDPDGRVRTALQLLKRQAPTRREDIDEFRRQHAEGRGHFERMLQEMRRMGLRHLAGHVTFSDYRPRKQLLFVRVPSGMRDEFHGPGRATVRQLQRAVGVDIKLERD